MLQHWIWYAAKYHDHYFWFQRLKHWLCSSMKSMILINTSLCLSGMSLFMCQYVWLNIEPVFHSSGKHIETNKFTCQLTWQIPTWLKELFVSGSDVIQKFDIFKGSFNDTCKMATFANINWPHFFWRLIATNISYSRTFPMTFITKSVDSCENKSITS